MLITENSAGIPVHAYFSPAQTGGGSPYMHMISKNLVVPMGLSVISHVSDDDAYEENDMDLKEIPDSLFDRCLSMVTLNKKQMTKKRRKKKRASKRSWF